MRFSLPLAFVLATTSLTACSAGSEGREAVGAQPVTPPATSIPAPAPSSPADPSRDVAVRDLGLVVPEATPAPFTCRPGAFCDDFENDQSSFTRWTGVVRSGGGKLETNGDSASVGRSAITLFAPDAASHVFLDHTTGGVGTTWSGAVGFALKMETAPERQLGGPELLLKTEDGPISVRVSVRPEGLVLEQLAPECGKDRCHPIAHVIAPAKVGAYYRVRIGFEVGAQKAPPYGRIETTVDDGPLVTSDLVVPLYDGGISLRAGITEGDTKRALVSLDDVSLFTR